MLFGFGFGFFSPPDFLCKTESSKCCFYFKNRTLVKNSYLFNAQKQLVAWIMTKAQITTLLLFHTPTVLLLLVEHIQQLSLISAGDGKCLTLLNASTVILAYKYKCRNSVLSIKFLKWILHKPNITVQLLQCKK